MARTTGSVKHTHQYFQRKDGCWACSGIEGCSHYMPRNMNPLPMGKQSICWGCEKEFMLTPANMQNSNPRCDACSEQFAGISQYLDIMEDRFKPTAFTKVGKEIHEKLHGKTKDEIEVIEAEEEK